MFVGSRHIHIHDDVKNLSFPALILYPTDVPSQPTLFGPFRMNVSPNAHITAGQLPLVVISHGTGGSHLLYRTIAVYLAKHGYIVVALEHPGNNRTNNELEDTHENLVNRPRHVRLTIDVVYADPLFSVSVQPNNVAIIGHSLGGYTALAVAGGTPQSKRREQVDIVPDSRVCAIVLLALATAFYIPEDSLHNVHIPILMLVAEHDPYTPRWHAELVINRVPAISQVTWRVVENAGHFSFLSPFPLSLRHPTFLPATDPDGFDREQFHEQLPEEIRSFLETHMQRV